MTIPSWSIKSKATNHHSCTILDNRVYESFVLANEPFAKTLRILETYPLVDNNLCENLVPALEGLTTFDERFKVTSVSIFIPDFSLLSCKLHSFTSNVIYNFTYNFILY